MASYDIRPLQMRMLRIMEVMDRTFREHNISYGIFNGSLLGAVRHGGFIPWDDDVDVAMPRPDYEHFLRIAGQEFEYPYEVLTIDTDEKYIFPFTKIIDKRAKVRTTSRKNEQIWNVWVDVFPLDSMPKNKIHFTIRKYHILYRRMMFLFSCFDDMVSVNKKNRPFIEKAMIKLGSTIHPDRFLNTTNQIRKFNRCLRRYRFSRGYYIINLMGIYKFRSLMERPIYGKKTEIPFEGVNFRVPEQYELYLEKIYGDYMALPPEEQRNHHEIELITED